MKIQSQRLNKNINNLTMFWHGWFTDILVSVLAHFPVLSFPEIAHKLFKVMENKPSNYYSPFSFSYQPPHIVV